MSTRTLILALFFGASVAAGSQLVKMQLTAVPEAKTTDVMVLVKDVPRGKTLKADMLAKRSYAIDALPFGVVTKLEDAVGRVSSMALPKGVLLENMLAPKGTSSGLQGMIPEGKRAFAIRTPNVASGVAGLLQPSDHVDVLLTVDHDDPDADSGGGAVVTLMRDVEVLAVDQHLDGSVAAPVSEKAKARSASAPTGSKTVTLLVSPNEAMRLSLAQTKGTLQLTLRSGGDGTDESLGGVVAVTFNDLLGRTKKAVHDTIGSETVAESATAPKEVKIQPVEYVASVVTAAPAPAVEVQVAQVPKTPELPPIVMYEGNSRSSIALSMVRGQQFVSRFYPDSVANDPASTNR